ncbi:pentachlorophenol monooxygenase/3-(3-hydroxy-phenyl)propionate hydroxylase [Nocardiopsis arvandica]|uniref:Pentachlorophenol monooxygenase/3-(3-hydroxy-phenyl)propionate hydroxylase n=1 Tax=Nocardiopsis sinuspersici TaxID=501010 RepID=A0A7Z0BL22_9ACTN|nr:FAD-dependent monooxygenase [Nocardiopsis sinuspersici]NYH55413.1 pentachlorophenol monooxygenase/3-(3-hydroxy-phenyl)propionate hydroxylase [Nocardiopsis sinuspersici]
MRPPAPRIPADPAADPAAEPVLVLGAGPVGQTAALLLARRGVPVLVVDGRPERDAVGSKAICQQRDVLDVWDWLGAGTIAREGLTWDTARTFYRGHELFSVHLADPAASSLPPFVNISQSRTEEVLDERMAQAGVPVLWNHRVTGIAQDGHGVTVECHTPQGPVSLRGSHALSCLGAHGGVVREALGLAFDGTTFDDRFLICDIRADLAGWERERRFYFDPEWNPGRQVLIHPCPDSVYRIDWQVPADFDLAAEESSGRLEARIRQIIGERPYEIVWHSVYRFHTRVAERMREGRVLLLGDNAHLVAPFGARGLNSGVQDAENAAWKLAYVLAGWAGEELLESYHAERHAAALENADVTSATMRFLVPHDEEAHRTRVTVLEQALTEEAARARVDSGRLAEPFWYTDSALTTPCPERPFGGRPPRGQAPAPCPGVILPDAPVTLPGEDAPTRVRPLLREGLTLLVGAAPQGREPGAFLEGVRTAAREATRAPVHALYLDGIDTTGALTRALDPAPGQVWLVRPDAHVAAVVAGGDTAAVRAAVRTALGFTPGVPEPIGAAEAAGLSAEPADTPGTDPRGDEPAPTA